MSINQITIANTFGQLITAVAAVIAVANNFTDGPQSQTGSTWTFTNANVGVNVLHTLVTSNANVGILNLQTGNITSETVGTSNISVANVTTLNVTNETVQNLFVTASNTVNANIIHLELTVANVFSANIETANIGSLGIVTLAVTGLTVGTINASFANITTLSVSGTSQHNALVATLLTTDNANVRILNTSTANITGETVGTSNISVANITNLTVGTQNISFGNITSATIATLNSSFANITSANIAQANIVQMVGTTITTLNVSSANLTTITSNTLMSFDPSANLHIATKHYADTGAGGNVVWKNTFTAKGDIPSGTGVNTFSVITSGVNGQSLIVDTQTASGLRWANSAPSQVFRGLSMQTSVTDFKNSNANNIILEHVDEISMNDGELVGGWTDKSVIINTANSGVGGLDTGTMLANTWYEIYAIRKRSDGTKNFILHRALDRNVDQNTAGVAQFTHSATIGVNKVTLPNVRVAQSFVANVSGPLTSFEMRMFKTGTPTGNVWIQLHANTAGDPGASALAISRKYDVARMAITTHYPIRFVFDVTANVVATTSYFAVAQTDFTASDTNFITLEASTVAYFNGVTKSNTGAAWASAGVGTLIFKEYVEANSTSLTFPAGYDQKCLVGYTATDQAGKLREFTQRDRTITCPFVNQWNSATLIGTDKEVMDLTATLPPVTVMASFFFFTGAINAMSVGRLHAIDLVIAVTEGLLGGIVWGATYGGTTPTAFPVVWVEHQAINVRITTGAKVYIANFTF